ncbi:MAG: hypothetical protein GXO21_08645, partial [Aquificae bacterium]|nr:hypothetical protein [Aquificota bacterium]
MFNERFWFIVYLILFFLLSLSVVKIPVGFEARVGQIFLLLMFGFILLYDARKRTLNIKILSYFLISGLIISLISKLSTYEKVGELKFIVKYLFIFPAAFYVGMKMFQFLSIRKIVAVFEISGIIYGAFALFLNIHPIEAIMHIREGLEGFQGTFYEPSGLAEAIGLVFISSLALRSQFNLWDKPYYVFSVYVFLLIIALLTKNKTIWISLFAVMIFSIFYKLITAILLEKRVSIFKDIYTSTLENLKKISILRITVILLTFSFLLYLYNASLEEPIISKEILEEKMETERGKAFFKTVELLEKSNWIGGYGYGFVEAYFSKARDEILGLGEGVSMIFNSYLDAWLSGSIFKIL